MRPPPLAKSGEQRPFKPARMPVKNFTEEKRMSLVINTNISSLDAQRNLWATGQDLSVAMQRLSSGLRINSAKDDAAGYAIASGMTAQINGLGQAISNSNNANGMLQTMMGAMNQVQDALQRMNELAVEASDASNSDSNRTSLNTEYQQLMDEITTIAGTTQFNGQTVLNSVTTSSQGASLTTSNGITSIASDGNAVLTSGDYTLNVSIGASVVSEGTNITSANGISSITASSSATAGTGYSLNVSVTQNVTAASGLTGVSSVAESSYLAANSSLTFDLSVAGTSVSTATLTIGNSSVTFDATSAGSYTFQGISFNYLAGASISNFSSTITVGDLTASLTVGTGSTTQNVSLTTVSSDFSTATADFTNLGVSVNVGAGLTNISASNAFSVEQVASLTMSMGSTTQNLTVGTFTQNSFGTGTLDFTDLGVNVGYNASLTNISTTNTFDINASTMEFQVGSNEGDTLSITGVNVTIGNSGLSVSGSDLSTQSDAQAAISTIATALNTLASSQGTLGASSNRLDTQVANLQSVSENTSAAKSQIVDADFAAETAQMTRDLVLQQAGVSVLAQANSEPQMILKLLP